MNLHTLRYLRGVKMVEVSFVVFGEPMAKQRPKMTTINGHAHAYTPKDTINYENRVMVSYKGITERMFNRNDKLSVSVNAYFGLTKADYGKKGLNKSGREKIDGVYCDKHKDLDNIIKVVLDGLNGVAYVDDKQVVEIRGTKKYTLEEPRVEVTISVISSLMT